MKGFQIDSGPIIPRDNMEFEGHGGAFDEVSWEDKAGGGKEGSKVPCCTPMAICGMGLRVPGGASTPEEFWEFLVNKGDARSKVPKSRYDVDAYYSPEKKAGAIASQYGYFLDESVSLRALDTTRFSLSRAELEFADPQQRKLLEVVREAFDDAGEVDFRGARIGCYLGNMGEDWGELMNRDPLSHGPNRIDGYNDWMLGNRISYEFGLTGPSLTIRTACSSGLVGLNEACAAIQRGAAEGAIVAGSTLIMAPGTTQSMSEKGILGPDGSCKTFSADANGYARGEAIIAIYVKPLEAAVRDGNPIRGVIRSALSNSDGKTQGITNPNPHAHEALVRKAYELAGITDFSKTAFFECHGTGTAVGDPLETGAVARIFGEKGIHITSVKPNVGHTEGASGLVSLIKAVKALENRTIPPNIKFTTPNPKIPFKEGKLTVPVEPTPFPEDREERVSVNSFGLGGSNAHVIVDSARSFGLSNMPDRKAKQSDVQLLLFSAGSAASLKQMVGDYEDMFAQEPDMMDRLDDIAYTLANRREHLAHRAFKIVGEIESPASAGKKIPAKPSDLIMCFTGQGAQWPRMGQDLMQRDNLCYRETILALDRHLQALPEPPEWTIEKELSRSQRTSKVQMAEFSQPLCTAVQIALVDLFAAIGVKPVGVVGHSSGELAAAYAAGSLTAQEAIVGAYYRGRAATLQQKKGAMAAVGLGWDEVEKYLDPPRVIVACSNSPKSVTLSGDLDAVKETLARIKEDMPDITARLLKVEKAYHSYHMAEIGDEYNAMIRDHVSGKVAQLPFFSSVAGTGIPEKQPLTAKYWQQNLESPVLFSFAVAGLLKHYDNPVFLEVGPHGALAGPARQIFAHESVSPPYLSALVRNENCVEKYLASVGSLFEHNIDFDFKTMFPGQMAMSGLPRYPWHHEAEYWYESRMSEEWRWPSYPKHELLGRRCLETTDFHPSFRNLLSIAEAPWLRGHVIDGAVVFPAAGYAAMAGEAVRQLTGINDAYSLRHVVLSQALVLSENIEVEVVTSLQHHRLSDVEDSEWWEFTIASYNGSNWVKHCTGQVSAKETEPAAANVEGDRLPRKLPTSKMYDSLADAGMQYSGDFQLLEGVEVDTVTRTARAKLKTRGEEDEGAYHLHPTVIDAGLQLGLVASVQGKISSGNLSAMPTLLEDATITRADTETAEVTMVADTEVKSGSGQIDGAFQVVADGKAVMDIKEAHFTPITADRERGKHQLPVTARVEWREHIEFQDLSALMVPTIDRKQWTPKLDAMSKLCIQYINTRIEALDRKSENVAVEKYKAWIERQWETIGKDSLMLMSPAQGADMIARIDEARQQLESTPVAPCAAALWKVAANIDDLLSDSMTGYGLLAADETLLQLFRNGSTIDKTRFVNSLAHARPSLRVLEVGVISGDSIASLLDMLQLPISKPMYSKYTVTSHSASMIPDFKKQFADIPNMEFRVLDIEGDLLEQEFGDAQFDLIIATNTLHGGKAIQKGLANCRKLLAPRGKLLVEELYSDSKWVNVACGLFEDWWYGEGDGREDEPYVEPGRWREEFKQAGLDIDLVALDGESPYQLSAAYIASPMFEVEVSKRVTILSDDTSQTALPLANLLTSEGWKVEQRRLGEALPASQDIIAMLEEEEPFLENPSEERFKALQKLLVDIGEAGLFWITKPSQIKCSDPRFAQIIGASRSIRNEELLAFATCEVDDLATSTGKVVEAFTRFNGRDEDETFRPDLEYAVSEGKIYVPRIYPFALAEMPMPETIEESRMFLVVDEPGRLAAPRWDTMPLDELKDNDVKVMVMAAGLSSTDVAHITGQAAYPAGGLGTDASGIVTRIGPDVKDFVPGDRVMCIGAGAMASWIVTSSELCEKIPEHVSFEQAATLPTAYCTAVAAIYEAGSLKTGQSILVHNADRGAAKAAVFLAMASSADLYVTGTGATAMDHINRAFGLPTNRIFNCEDASFVHDVMRETDGKGVDLVLNWLPGALLHETWKCVAEFGKMVELDDHDLLASAKLEMSSFLGGRSFCGVFLDAIIASKPANVKRLLQLTRKLLEERRISPLGPFQKYEVSDIQSAIADVQDQAHKRQAVVSFRGPEGNLKAELPRVRAADEKGLRLDDSASYLLAGGLGGIGSVIARHLVEHGARAIVSLSRNPGSRPEEVEIIRELESMGCKVTLAKGDLVNKDDIARAVSQSPNLKGIVHCPMLLADEGFKNMTVEQWNRASDPKVKGAWYLHEATVESGFELDFFLFLSSMSGLNGQPGQANYSGANTFLDAFVQYRQSLGLNASSIDIGAVADMGYAARDGALLKRLLTNGYSGCTEAEILEAVTAAIRLPKPDPPTAGAVTDVYVFDNVFATGFGSEVSLSSPESRSWWKSDIRMAVWHNTAGGDVEGPESNVKSFVAKSKQEPDLLKAPDTVDYLANEIGKQLMGLLLQDADNIDISVPVDQLGLDSLVGIELRNWWKQTFGFDIPVLQLLGLGTLENLGKAAAEGLLKTISG